jgi:hypothetical protein
MGQDHHQVKEEVQVTVNRIYVLTVNVLAIVSRNVLISNVLKEHLQMLQLVQIQIFLQIHNLDWQWLKQPGYGTALLAHVNGNNNLWIANTGASCHMTCSPKGMFDCVDIDEDIKLGDGKYIKATKVGHKQGTGHQPNGKQELFVILNCKLVPDLWVNLFSITSSLRHGWSISNEGIMITLSCNEQSLFFDQVLESSTDAITGVILEPVMFPEYNNVGVSVPTVQEEEAAVLNDMNGVEVVPDPDAFAEIIPDAPPPDIDPPPPVVTWDVNVGTCTLWFN